MNERERMLSGKLYHAGDPVLVQGRQRAKELCHAYNTTLPEQQNRRDAILRELFGSVGEHCWIEPTFRCDYGTNISIGDCFYANYDCIFLDVAPITIGDHVYIAPRVCLYTARHPTVPEIRNLDLEFGLPITIQDDVWIGGNVVVVPGVTIGRGSVIAAGAVVTRDVPPGVIAGGNPCRVLRPLTDADRARWEAERREYQDDHL